MEPKRIIDKSIKQLRKRNIKDLKVKWTHCNESNATWKIFDVIIKQYPHLLMNLTLIVLMQMRLRLLST
jgi:hypothetical protein